jgi:hypothetical protein
MEGDDVEIAGWLLEISGNGTRDVGVGNSMETVFAQLVLFGNLEVDGISMDVRRDGGVKTGVEVGDVCGIWQERGDGFDNCESWCVVS